MIAKIRRFALEKWYNVTIMNPELPKAIKAPEKEEKREISIVAGMLQGKLDEVSALVSRLVGKPDLAVVAAKQTGRLESVQQSIDEHKENPGNILAQFIFFTKTYVSLMGVEMAIKSAEYKTKEVEELEKATQKLQESQRKLEAAQAEKLSLSKDQEERLKQELDEMTKKAEKDKKSKDETIAIGFDGLGKQVEQFGEKAKEVKTEAPKNSSPKTDEDAEAILEVNRKLKEETAGREDKKGKKGTKEKKVGEPEPDNSFMRTNAYMKILDDYQKETAEGGTPDFMEYTRRIMEARSEASAKYGRRGDIMDPSERLKILLNDDDAERIFEEFFKKAYAQQSENFYKTISFKDQMVLDEFFTTFTNEDVLKAAYQLYAEKHPEISFDVFQDMSRKKLNRFSQEFVARATIFNGHMGIEKGWIPPTDLYKAMGPMAPELWKYVFPENDKAAVSFAMNAYENVFHKRLDEKDRIEHEDVATLSNGKGMAESAADEDVRAQVKSYVRILTMEKLGLKGDLSNEDKQRLQTAMNEKWPDWKLSKAVVIAKSAQMVNLRSVEIAAKATEERKFGFSTMKSGVYEDYQRVLDVFDKFLAKYWVGGAAASMIYLAFGNRYDKDGHKRNWREMYKAWEGSEVRMDAVWMKNIRNMLTIGGEFTESGWRGPEIAQKILDSFPKLAPLVGVNIRLQTVGGVDRDLAKEEHKVEKRKSIWDETLFFNPMGVMREAQTLMGFSKDYRGTEKGGLWTTVYKESKIGGGIESKEVQQARNDLDFVQVTSLSMLNVDAEKMTVEGGLDKNTFLNFNLLEDPTRRKNAVKLNDAIRKVAGSEVEWQIDKNGKDYGEDYFGKGEKYSSVMELLARRAPEYLKQGLVQNDIRRDLLEWEKMGHIGWVRRLRDFSAAASMQHALGKFFDTYSTLESAHSIVEYLKKEVSPHMKAYDGNKAADFMEKLAYGMAEFHREPTWWARVPAPIPHWVDGLKKLLSSSEVGEKLMNKMGIESSDTMSEEAYGEETLITSAVSTRQLITGMRAKELFGSGHRAHQIEQRLLRDTRSTFWEVTKESFYKYWIGGVAVVLFIAGGELFQKIEADFRGGGGSAKKGGGH